MEITWYGRACFRMTERGTLTVVTDPFSGSEAPSGLKADVITISRDHLDANNVAAVSGAARGDVRQIVGPGEYEMGGVFITGIAMKPEKGKEGNKCTVYAFNFDGMTVAHLGGLAFVPSQQQIDALETVDILLLPIGGEDELSPTQASEVISMIEPSIVIPMGYGGRGGKDTLGKFLKEMGLTVAKTSESLKVTRRDMPEDTQVILLDMKG
ncbi:MAG: MBL fold metallo-hydrolase [Chloroflexi bacterium]|nr:MBL fold metallo-hydrolase [Chloroflexota bacterium]